MTRAPRRLGTLIHEPALRAVRCRTRQVVDVNDASQYRLRLIAAELIHATRREYVDLALPYLRESAVTDG